MATIADVGGAISNLSPIISKVLYAVLILLVGFILGRVVGLLARRFLVDIQLGKHLRNIGIKVPFERFVGSILSFLIYLITLFFALNTLGLTSALVTIILAGIFFVVLVSFLLAVKDFFPNLISGFRIKLGHMFEPGDEIQIREVQGVITRVGWIDSALLTKHKEEIIIPNSIFTKRKIVVKRHSK